MIYITIVNRYYMPYVHTQFSPYDVITNDDIEILPIARFKYIPDIKELERNLLRFEWSEEFYRERMVTYPHLFYGAFYNNILIGYICGCVKFDQSRITRNERHIQYHGLISKLAVLPEFQGQGIGKALVLMLIDAFEQYVDVHTLKLQVRESNANALRLYTNPIIGFTITDEFEYSNGEHGYELTRKLHPIDP